MLFTFASTFAFSAFTSASAGVCGPGLATPSMRAAPFAARLPAAPVVVAAPGWLVAAADPEDGGAAELAGPAADEGAPAELAVPVLLVPGAVGILAELPAPLGS